MIEGERLILRLPTKEDEKEILEMVKEFKDNGELKIPGSNSVENFDVYDEWLENIKLYSDVTKLPEGMVLSTQYISIRKSDNKLIGFVNLRHELNDYLLKFGGHIGDSIRPSERRKGYGTEQLKICIEYCKTIGINEVLITCKDWNNASKASIMKCGGKFENIQTDTDGNNLERYWIRREYENFNKQV